MYSNLFTFNDVRHLLWLFVFDAMHYLVGSLSSTVVSMGGEYFSRELKLQQCKMCAIKRSVHRQHIFVGLLNCFSFFQLCTYFLFCFVSEQAFAHSVVDSKFTNPKTAMHFMATPNQFLFLHSAYTLRVFLFVRCNFSDPAFLRRLANGV